MLFTRRKFNIGLLVLSLIILSSCKSSLPFEIKSKENCSENLKLTAKEYNPPYVETKQEGNYFSLSFKPATYFLIYEGINCSFKEEVKKEYYERVSIGKNNE